MPNLFIVVDENDNIIWYKAKAGIDPEKEFYRVSALRLTNSQWDILIAQRAYNKSHNPGKRWPAVAGTVEEWETYEENIIKEMEEEIGLTGIKIVLWPKFKKNDIWGYHYFTQRFFATIDKDISEFTIQKEELEGIKRISKEALLKDIENHPEHYLVRMKKYVEEFS
jgi:isopentenyldiphosphate isomerase